MSDALLLVLALAVSTAGMAAFAVSIGAHWRQIAGDRPHPFGLRVALRFLGTALLTAALGLCWAADPAAMAMLVWPMLLMVAAGAVAVTLSLHAALHRQPGNLARLSRPEPSRRRGAAESTGPNGVSGAGDANSW